MKKTNNFIVDYQYRIYDQGKSQMEPRTLVLVVSSDTYPSKRNKKIIKKTWIQNCPDNINVFFYKSGTETFINKNNEIILIYDL